jgi:hypothetical protein
MPAARPKPEPAWKKTLEYQRGDTLDALKVKTLKRVRLAIAAGDTAAARSLLSAWQEAKKNLSPPTKAR